jgi:Zn-finger protein
MPEQGSRFFQNRACEYFPCHRGADAVSFNCLFCYCPLYFLEACGGDFRLTHGVKDCTACLRPHRSGGYDEILTRLRQEAAKRRTP